MVNLKLAEVALEYVEGTAFEHFFNAFYPALAGIEFVPLGGNHDGGADAFQDNAVYEGVGQRPGTFYQASIQVDHRSKIRGTIKRLREFGRDPKLLTYITSRRVGTIDQEEETLSSKLEVFVKIRDCKWIATSITRPLLSLRFKPIFSQRSRFLVKSAVPRSSRLPTTSRHERCVCFLARKWTGAAEKHTWRKLWPTA